MPLLKVIIIVPMTVCEVERCFLILKRVKTFLRNTTFADTLGALAVPSIEAQEPLCIFVKLQTSILYLIVSASIS